jgi:hypothetical protein
LLPRFRDPDLETEGELAGLYSGNGGTAIPIDSAGNSQSVPEAEPILDSLAASFGGNASLALSELLIAHESIESFLDETEDSHSEEPIRQRDRSAREFRDGLTISWEKVN